MKRSYPALIEILIVIYTAIHCSELVTNWISSPYARFSWIALALWCAPVFFFWIVQSEHRRPSTTRSILLAGLGISLLGLLSDLNAVQHIGFAVAFAGLMPWTLSRCLILTLWLASAASWTPALGYFLKLLSPEVVLSIRLAMATSGSTLLLMTLLPLQRLHHDEH